MIVFIFLILAILLGAHFFVLHFIILAFGLSKYQIFIYILGFVLSASFLIASFTVHIFHNAFTRGIYYFSSCWLGILSNLFFSFVLVAIFLCISKLISLHLDLKILTVIAIVLSFGIGFYAMYNANNLVIKNVDIAIKNLPAVWENKKIVFISDIHIGAIIREKFLTKMNEKINTLNPDLVLISGDLFDGTDGELHYAPRYINEIEAKQGIYYVNGNHELYLGTGITDAILEQTKVRILNDEVVNIDGVQLVGVGYIEKRFPGKNIDEKLAALKEFNKTIPSILLYHSPVYTKEFANFGINLQLSGHTHKGQIWPYGWITALWYKGMDFGLVTKGDYNIYTTNGVGTWGPPMRVGNNPEIVVLNLKTK